MSGDEDRFMPVGELCIEAEKRRTLSTLPSSSTHTDAKTAHKESALNNKKDAIHKDVNGQGIPWMPEGLNTLEFEEEEDPSLQAVPKAVADFSLQRKHHDSRGLTPNERIVLKKEQDDRIFFLRKGLPSPVPLWNRHGKEIAHVRLYPSPLKGGILPGGPVSDSSIRQVFFFSEGNPFLLVHGSVLLFSELRCASFSDLCSEEDSVRHLLDFINRHKGLCYLSFSFAPSQWTLYKFSKFLRELLKFLSWFPATRKTVFVRLPDSWVQDEVTDKLCLQLRATQPYFITLQVQLTLSYNETQQKTMQTYLEHLLGRSLRIQATTGD